jgi:lipid-A-disaccharide synthase
MFLPQMIAAVAPWRDSHTIVVVAANDHCRKLIDQTVKKATVITGDNYNAMAAAEAVLTSTGTTTLECALIGTPLIAVYRFGRFSYWLIQKIHGRRLPRYKALPNMLVHREIIPELIQEKCTVENIRQAMKAVLENPVRRKKIRQELGRLRKSLERKDVLRKNAAAVVRLLNAE